MTARPYGAALSEQGEPTPWFTGLLVSAFAVGLMGVAVFAFGEALARIHPLLAWGINIIAVGGAAPSVLRWRRIPVVRWVVYGSFVGVALGWAALLLHGL